MDEALGTCNIIELRHRSLKTLSLPLLPAPPPQRHPAFEACSWLLAEKMAGRQAVGRLTRLMSGEVPVERMAEMMAPKVVDGRWRKPELSRRLVAKVRKAWALDGREWPFEEKPRTNYGGWKVQDLPQVKQKGKKVDREKIDRYATLGRDDPSAAAFPDGVTNEQTFSLLSSSRFRAADKRTSRRG